MKKINLLLILSFLINSLTLFSQNETKSIEEIIIDYKENYANSSSEFSTKLIDLDNDGDLDYIFSFGCGEGNCLRLYLKTNDKYIKVIDEFGIVSYNFMDSKENKASKLILNSISNHCCGESPFGSNRDFSFNNNKLTIENNYVYYNYEIYNEEDNYRLTLVPDKILHKGYQVTIKIDNYNVRFSADLKQHNSTFTCPEKTNIIAKLRKGAIVKVIGEFKGNDSEERTWLYVEIPNQAINDNECPSPISYGFEKQKLRGWISNKYVKK